MNFDKKSLNLQYLTDETGNKIAAVLPVPQLEGLVNQLAELAKAAASRPPPPVVESKPATEYSLVDQEILLIKEQYERLNTLLNELQKYKELQTELDRKLFFQRLVSGLETDLQGMRTQLGDLKKSTKPAPLYQVPEAPKNIFLPTTLFAELKAKLLAAEASDGQKPPLFLEAPSGTGKSSLAMALARDEEVRRVFPDGIFWIELSKAPPLLGDQINWVVRTLDAAEASFVDLEEASEYLRKLCVTRACLLILDDVWDAQDILSFNVSSSHSQLLITTSDSNLFNITQYFIKNIKNYTLKPLPEKAAGDYFGRCLGKKDLTSLPVAELVASCGYLPEALKLAANLVQILPAAGVLEQLRNPSDEFSDRHPRALMQALHLNVQALGEQADYYLSLAVFANYTRISQNTVLMLWRYLYQVLDETANNFIKELADKGLLEVKEQAAQRYLSLHSYQHDYLTGEAELEKLHSHLLAAYRRQCGQHGWLSGPSDGYFFENLAKHLVQAGRRNELKLLLLDFDWMQKKLQLTNVYSLIHDYELLEDRDVEVIKKALYEAVPILMNYKAELAVQLLDRLWGEKNLQNNKDIQALLNQAKETSPQWRWQPHFDEEELKKKGK